GIELPKALNPKGSAKIESGPFVLAMSNLAEAQTSIAEIALQKMYAYPSIVKSMLTIVFDNQSTKNSVQIYTLQGVEVYNSSIVSDSEIRIPATVLTSGMYVVKITSNGKQTLQSIVVE
ncbi:MAG TPA: T9SS type A sorting domain-containing protein, partial [Bacteroidales bacterium]|nr:T9SS type A sorting domain-containing protein [Bacteroidales bacterium]